MANLPGEQEMQERCSEQEVQVAAGVHQHALWIGQDDHAVAVPHLLEQVLHDRL